MPGNSLLVEVSQYWKKKKYRPMRRRVCGRKCLCVRECERAFSGFYLDIEEVAAPAKCLSPMI